MSKLPISTRMEKLPQYIYELKNRRHKNFKNLLKNFLLDHGNTVLDKKQRPPRFSLHLIASHVFCFHRTVVNHISIDSLFPQLANALSFIFQGAHRRSRGQVKGQVKEKSNLSEIINYRIYNHQIVGNVLSFDSTPLSFESDDKKRSSVVLKTPKF